jgi:autotransporter-associated beta strand protein
VAATDTSSFNRTLTLRGSNTGDNLIQGAIINNIGGSGGKVGLTKNDNGTWVLAGANALTPTDHHQRGTLRIGNGGTTGSRCPPPAPSPTTASSNSDAATPSPRAPTSAVRQSREPDRSSSRARGTTILNVNNTYDGLTTINAGALRILHAGALGAPLPAPW